MNIRAVLASLLLASPTLAFAQSTDPVDRNNAGPFGGLNLNLGQAHGVGADDNGTAYLVSADVGYVMKRDTWNRIELGLELGTGKAEFGSKGSDFVLDLGLVALVKAGYGYSLGDHAFGMFRVGFGIASGEGEVEILGGKTSEDVDGTVALVGYDVVFPASETLDFTVGLNYRIYNLKGDDVIDNFQVNVPAINAGARVRF